MYKIDHKNLRAKIKNLEYRLDFQKYNIKKKEEEEGKKKNKIKQENKQTNKETKPQELLKTTNNHTNTIYGVCFEK